MASWGWDGDITFASVPREDFNRRWIEGRRGGGGGYLCLHLGSVSCETHVHTRIVIALAYDSLSCMYRSPGAIPLPNRWGC